MTPIEALRAILEITYAGHPDGREARLQMIERYARSGLNVVDKTDPVLLKPSEILERGTQATPRDINRMSNTLQRQGQIEPLQVKRLTKAEGGDYEFGTFSADPWGNAILMAAEHLGWATVQVVVQKRYEP